jgi:tetratricopeptide (TPR) repeat protein
MLKFVTRVFAALFFCSALLFNASAQPTLPSDLKKPKKFENKQLGSEKTANKKFTLPRRFVQNTVTHYNWYFNADNKLTEIVDRAKAAHIDDYSQLLSFYNYDLDVTATDSSELDSVLYRSNAGILIHDLRNSWIDNLYMLMGRAYFYKKELDSAYVTFQYINYAFSPKEKDGYDKPIGSNATEGGNAFSVSTKEKNSLPKKAFTTPPSRNESFIWQIRTFIEKDELAEAAGLIETLKADPVFPDRLQPDLYEVQASWFYKKQIYDSAAAYLEKALGNAENKQEEARWEYLIAQLYERSNHPDLAEKFYNRAIKHTLNPVLEVFATLNSIRQNKSDSIAIQRSLNELKKMGRKDRYTNYRDIIYYTAAQIELERNNIPGAKALLLKATQVQGTNPAISQRTKAFLLLGDLSYKEKKYLDAKRYYDSIVNNDPAIENPDAFENRKNILTKLALQAEIIEKQDSLQRIASLTEAEREAFIRKLVKQLRKEQGLREEENIPSNAVGKIDNRAGADLFDDRVKGEWYFYNPSLKSRGYTEFKGRWGNRPNADNWRRLSAVTQAVRVDTNDPGLVSSKVPGTENTELSYEAMLKNVPLTPMQLNASNEIVQSATVDMSTLYMEGLEDYPTVIETLERFLERFPNATKRSQALFQLYYSYTKTGDIEKADNILKLMQEKYPGTEYEKLASNSKKGLTSDPLKNAMTAKYDSIYTLFIEGRFDEALAQKKVGDSMYSTNYWTPQLLYIESIYHIRQRDDSTARATLQQITRLYPSTPMAGKAQTLIDVLNRRNEIESYLTNLQITRPVEDTVSVADTLAQKAVVVTQPAQPMAVTDPKPPPLVTSKVDVTRDTMQTKPLAVPTSSYSFDPSQPHSVVIVMDKVDGVYVSESKNAFNRYNKEKFYNKVIDITNVALNDTIKLVVMTNFENAAAALDYLEKTRKVAAREIVPWLPAGKYQFILISSPNLEILKSTKDIGQYRKFLLQSFPGKFE